MKKLNLIKRLLSYSHEKQKPQRFGRYAVMLIMLFTLGVGQMWGAWIGNCGIDVNGTWYKSSSNINSGHWLESHTSFASADLGTITSLELGGQYDSWDNSQTDYCSWNSNNGIWITIKLGDTQIDNFKLSCFNSGKDGNNNVWKTYGTKGSCSDDNEGWNTYTVDISEYAAGNYTLKASWTSPSSQSLNNTANFTIDPVVTFKANGGTGSDYTQTVTYNSATALTANTFSKTGYTFLGWATTADGDVVYADGASVTLTAHTDLYAKWGQQSLTITSYPEYLTTTGKITLGINYANIPAGRTYRVKINAGYEPECISISGTGSTIYNCTNEFGAGAKTVVVELWNGSPGTYQSVVSNSVTVTGEVANLVNVLAKTDGVESTTGGTVSPASVNASAHIGQTITASEPTTGYDFKGWTANTVNITFADPSALSTTVYATAGGWVYANYVRQSGSYSTTFYAGDHGSIVVDETDIAKNGNETITIGENETLSATPESADYVFDHWGTTGSVSVANIYSATTTVTATAAGGTVTAYYRHVPELGAVTATPSGTQNYAGSPIDFALSVTSTYLAHPVVVFLVNDGTTTYEVVGAPYGADGSSAAGTIGSDAANTTVHKATFTASAAKSYTVSAKLYEGLLVENFETADYTTWGDIEGGTFSTVTNPYQQAGNGSSHVKQITPNGADWHTAITRTTTAWNNDYQYIHAKMYYQGGTGLKWKISDSPATELSQTIGSTNTWQDVAFNNSGRVTIAFMFPFVAGQTNTFYIDDIILSNEASMTEKASQAATASFSINWNYTVTLNNNGATDAGTESVNVTYGSATGITDITVPTKTGYTFGGYYTEDAGAGTLQINASGVWQNAGYVADGKWHSGSNQTLYAKWTEDIHTVTQNYCTGSTSVGIATAATVTCSNAPAGKKFDRWSISGTYSITSGSLTSRSITFTATTDVSITATYVDRTYKKVYFAKPSSWTSGLKVYAWDGKGTPTYKNAAWPGVEVTTTETVSGTSYYYYKFYTDNNGEGDNQTGATNWTKLVFSHKNYADTKTADLTLADGHYYHIDDGKAATDRGGKETATVSGSASPADWYVTGYFNGSNDWGYAHPIIISSNTGSTTVGSLTTSTTQYVKIYRASTNQWFKWTGGASSDYYDDKAAEIGTEMVMREYNHGSNYFTSTLDEYRFSLDVTSASNPKLTISPATDNDYSATISVHEDGHGSVDPAAGGITLHQYTPTTITATPQAGYRFKQWNVSGCTVTSSTSATTTAFATANGGTIEAEFTQEGIIYFDNTMSQWKGDIYVYFFSDNAWYKDKKDGKGPGMVPTVNSLGSGKMTRIGESNIYYYNYYAAGITPTGYIGFTKGDHRSSNGVYKTSAAWRGDFNSCMPMYIASQTWTTTNETGYHNAGYWKRYNVKNSGLTLRGLVDKNDNSNKWDEADEIEFTSTEENSNTFKASVTLGNATHQFKIYHPCVSSLGWLGNKGTMQPNNSTGWEMTETDNCQIYVPSTGTYVFTLNLGTDHIYLSVEYPLLANDYHLQYTGRITTSGSDSHKHPSQSVRHLTGNNKEQRDTVSFFIDKDYKGTLQLQKCTDPASNGGKGAWADTAVFVSLSDVDKTGIYNFEIVQTTNGSGVRTVTANILDAEHRKYNGDLFIRTDVADGGWDAYEQVEDNKLVFSDYAKSHSNYDHYHCHWTPTSKNLHFTIANEYSPSITDTMKTGAAPFNFEALPYEASVRFMYNSATNDLGRAYLNGSNEGQAEYLKIQAMNDSIRQNVVTNPPTAFPAANHSGDTVFVKFQDLGNWVYQYDLKAIEGTHYRLVSNYRYSSKDHLQYFKGNTGTWNTSTTEPLIGGTGTSWQKLRLVYDFKSNNLMAAWMPDGEVGSKLAIHADMMLIRRAQNAATQLTFATGKSLSDVKTMVGAVEFFKDSIVGRVGNFRGDVVGPAGNRANRELMLYISFPFDVAVNDIYGCGDYNKEWYIQYYDGAERARKGWFKGDGTTTFWKFIDRSDTLRAGVGYSLLLDNDYFNTDNAGVWKNIAKGGSVYLFFPSARELSGDSIIASNTKSITVPSHECTINRTFTSESGKTVNHKFTDSHWNMMGVPLFQNQTINLATQFSPTDGDSNDSTTAIASGSGYFFEWDSINNALKVKSSMKYEFKSMHAYMVQFCGSVTFTGSSIQPASVAARRTKVDREDYTLELQLLRNNNDVSRTYIELRDEACDTFALNEDVYMMYSSLPANLYTFAGNYDVSANVLSVANHTIPVGLTVRDAGTYTFSMPSNFSGGVTLVDNVLNTRTNLALGDYEVTLPKGVCEGRFALEIDVNKTPTSIDVIEDGGSLKDGKAHKFIMNDQMYILKNGELFDATGRRVK